ncbi:MAG: hypothetical protein ACYC0P_06855 [Thiobacillus sp.]
MARPTFEPTAEHRELVEQLAAFGIPQPDIANFVKGKNGKPITERTLRKYFRTELDSGEVKANVKVARGLFKNATTATETHPGGNPTSQIFWLKTRGGWKETPKPIELTGKNGGPVEQRTTVVDEKQIKAAVSKLEDEY